MEVNTSSTVAVLADDNLSPGSVLWSPKQLGFRPYKKVINSDGSRQSFRGFVKRPVSVFRLSKSLVLKCLLDYNCYN